jgi:predicted transposase YbfD/YdcC
LSREYLGWLKQFLPYKFGVPQAQTFRKVFRVLQPAVLEQRFASWFASLQEIVRGVIAIDGKTLRGSKTAADGSGALHLLSAYACEAGLVIAQRAVDGKSNEIKAIPELLDLLAIKGAIISIDAMGTQKAIAAKIAAQEGDYVLALKGNQTTLHDDVKTFFDDGELAKTCAGHTTTDTGHGRIEERTCRATDAIDWLQERHPDWRNLRAIAAITAQRVDKKTGQTSRETRFYITSLSADPAAILAATRAHWGIENNLHWQLDVTFNEDRCRSRKDFAPLNLAIVRHLVLNILKRDQSKISLKRKRLKASVNQAFRAALLAA